LYSTPHIIRVTKSMRVKWAVQIQRMKEITDAYTISRGNLKGRSHLTDVGTDGRKILRHSFRKYIVRVSTGFSWLMIESICEHDE